MISKLNISREKIVRKPEADDESALAVETTATTKFVDDGTVVVKSFTSSLDSLMITPQYESILDFLAKPYLVYSNTWKIVSVQAVDTIITTVNPAAHLVSYARWAEKLSGFSWMTGTAVLRVMINCQPFQAGKLLIHFLPCVSDMLPSYKAMHNINYVTKTQQPHVILDANDSMAELEIPYISAYDSLTIADGSHGWGEFYVSVLAGLRTGTTVATDAPISVYLYFKDVKLTGPREPEVGEVKGKSVSSKEAEAIYNSGSISSGLAAISAGFSKMGSVPMLGAYATTASWVSDVASKTASALGYSKPVMVCPPNQASRQLARFAATSDGVDTSYPLAVRHDNATAINSGLSVRNQDEMSIDFLKGIPANFFQHTWVTTNAVDTQILEYLVRPDLFFQPVQGPVKTGHYLNMATGPPIWYLSKLFDQWRGSIKITFQFAKTIFHTGRLQVTFVPGDGVITSPVVGDSTLNLRQIIDLKTSNEFSVTLPYLLPYDYQAIGGHMGKLVVTVLNPLRCPDTCDNTIDILAWASAGPDFQYAVPNGGYRTATIATGLPVVADPELGEDSSISEDSSVIGNSTIPMDVTHHAERCVGEVVTSTRQLLLRYNNLQAVSPLFPTSTANSLTIWPWFNSIVSLSAGGTLDAPNYGGDVFPFFANLYAFYKGGMRIRVNSTNELSAWVNPAIDPTPGVPIRKSAQTLSNRAATTWWALTTLGLGAVSNDPVAYPSFSVPYYCRTKLSFVKPQIVSTDVQPTTVSDPVSLLNVDSTNFANVTFRRAIGEDFQFTYFVGCPPLLVGVGTP